MRVTKSYTENPNYLELLRQRDEGILTQMVLEETPKLYRCIARLVRDPDEVQNLVQETFLQALRKVENFRGESLFSTWLCAIGINLARASLRRSIRTDLMDEADIEVLQPRFDEQGHAIAEYPLWNPERGLIRKEQIRILYEAIERLPEDYRLAITLRDLEELPMDEVARMLEITEGNLRVRLHRARNALRNLLIHYDTNT